MVVCECLWHKIRRPHRAAEGRAKTCWICAQPTRQAVRAQLTRRQLTRLPIMRTLQSRSLIALRCQIYELIQGKGTKLDAKGLAVITRYKHPRVLRSIL